MKQNPNMGKDEVFGFGDMLLDDWFRLGVQERIFQLRNLSRDLKILKRKL